MLDLKKLVVSHGSKLKEYLCADVSIIIASQMASSKMHQLKQPVVKPEWIHACIKESRLIDWKPFRLFDNLPFGQKNLDFDPVINDPLSLEADKKRSSKSISIPHLDLSERNANAPLDMSNKWIKTIISSSPGFIEKYFAKSRLHHLSTCKAELLDLVRKRMKQLGKKATLYHQNDPAIIMHIDMDCFFASVALRNRPDLRDKPVVIAHSLQGNANIKISKTSTSEIACANYAARKFGISNGSYLGNAMSKCSHLTVLPYNFPEYESVTKELYQVLIHHGDFVQAVSVDEAYIDVTKTFLGSGTALPRKEWSLNLAHSIRSEIFKATGGCCASIGIGENLLQARMATKKAKPDNAWFINSNEIEDFLAESAVENLPGVGRTALSKFQEMKITSCGSLAQLSLSSVQDIIGEQTGQTLYEYCRGIDLRMLENKPRQSIGAEINWGIRFETIEQVKDFFTSFCDHVHSRYNNATIIGTQVSVKAKKRNYTGEPSKFLGCGQCFDFSKTLNMPHKFSIQQLFNIVWTAYCSFSISAVDLRGVGIHLKGSEKEALEDGQTMLGMFPKLVSSQQNLTPQKRERYTTTTPTSQKIRKLRFLTPKSKKVYEAKQFDLFEKKFGINPRDVDNTVICHLPEDMKEELELLGIKNIENRNLASFYADPTSSQIDLNVLDCLPDAIQKELQDVFNLRRQKQSEGKKCLEIPAREQTIMLYPCLSGESDITVIREWLNEWTSSANLRIAPAVEDIKAINQYLLDLVHAFDLESCSALLSLLIYRIQSRKGKGDIRWGDMIGRILNDVDQEVFKMHASHLSIYCGWLIMISKK